MVNTLRNSNIELLRILAMLLIVQSHFAVHGYMEMVSGNLSSIGNGLNRFLLTAITTGNIGNGLFMLITGYYLSQSTSFRIRRFFRVVIQVFTYSVLCYIGYTVLYCHSALSLNGIVTAFTPLLHDTYWYFTCYILVYIFHPYLNALIDGLGQKQLGVVIMIMALTWGFVPSMLQLGFESSGFLVFCMFYFIGAYIRKYYFVGKFFNSLNTTSWFDKTHIEYLLFMCIVCWLTIALLCSRFTPFYRFVYMGSPIIILFAVFLFIYFLNLGSFNSRLINSLAGYMGGVYLLSDNPYMRSIIYQDIFDLKRFLESNMMIVYTLCFVFITLLVCLLIESIRKWLYDSVERLLTDRK